MIELLQIFLNKQWQLRSLSGEVLSKKFRFGQGGVIVGETHPNEKYWKFELNKLILLSDKNQPTSEFIDFYDLGGGHYQLIGKFLLDEGSKFILESQGQLDEIISNIAIESSLGKDTKKLVIQFNSASTPFDQNILQREFNTLIHSVGQNVVRVSQSKPTFWYVNFTNTLTKILGSFVSDYEEIFMLGSSAGGYAVLLLGEILASLYPNKKFTTFSINAKTTFDKKHIDFLQQNYDQQYFSLDIMDSSRLSYADCVETNISQYLKITKLNISHHVFYDIYNPVEKYHYSLIADFERVYLHGFELGLNHGDGCIHIGNSDYFIEKFIFSINTKL